MQRKVQFSHCLQVAIFISVISNVVANVNSQWYYECLFDGERHGHEIACNRYYECRGNAVTGYTIYLYKCPQGYLYNGAVNTCQVGFCDFPPSPSMFIYANERLQNIIMLCMLIFQLQP